MLSQVLVSQQEKQWEEVAGVAVSSTGERREGGFCPGECQVTVGGGAAGGASLGREGRRGEGEAILQSTTKCEQSSDVLSKVV